MPPSRVSAVQRGNWTREGSEDAGSSQVSSLGVAGALPSRPKGRATRAGDKMDHLKIDANGRLPHWPVGFFDEWDNAIDKLLSADGS